MSDMWDDIKEFHTKFLLPQEEIPNFANDEMMAFRVKFLREELQEFEDAFKGGDLQGGFDALIDLVYVAMGTAYIMNMPWDKGWEHVQRANMDKMRVKKAEDSKRSSTYDVVKPEGWIGPERMLLAEMLMHEHKLLVEKAHRSIIESLRIPKVPRPDEGDA